MRLQLSKSANATSLYIVKSTYDRNTHIPRNTHSAVQESAVYDIHATSKQPITKTMNKKKTNRKEEENPH